MAEKKTTPNEISELTKEAIAIGQIFIATVGTFPLTIPQLILKMSSIIAFFRQAKPHFEIIFKEIKD